MAGQELATSNKVGWFRVFRESLFTRNGFITAFGLACGWYLVSELIGDYLASKRARKLRELVERMTLQPREWKEEELRPYDGKDPEKPILIGVDGIVINVWRGRHFYGADGPYCEFAGKDATRLLAKQIVDPSEDDGKPLTAEEKENLLNWKSFLSSKYDDVGTLKAQ
eukprot:gb/GFBE01076344.1/.p1 GENE.gb/GFBE01076344.1/~~gb/GFBE01076344.1/.p1  ORF type:complete len:168 (+),score=47.95 gb/GFBE01076344.1/:1-504(+)